MKVPSYEKFTQLKCFSGIDITPKQKREILHVLNYFEKDQGETLKYPSAKITLARMLSEGVDNLILRRLLRNVKFSKAVTLKKMVTLYGKQKGKQKYDDWCYTNKISNTFEYKKEKYGWNKKQFSEFNSSRAVTKDNLIARHGEQKGLEIWECYVEKQRRSGVTLDYFIEKHGEKEGPHIYEELNKKKGITLENMKKKHGDIEGEKRYYKWLEVITKNIGVSKVSQDMCWSVYDMLTDVENNKTYFHDLNREFGLHDKKTDKPKLYDFVNTKLKLCIEFNGDIYHGNPDMFKEDDKPLLFLGEEKTAKEMWENDLYKNSIMKRRGYEVLVIWEKDYNYNKENELERIRTTIENIRGGAND